MDEEIRLRIMSEEVTRLRKLEMEDNNQHRWQFIIIIAVILGALLTLAFIFLLPHTTSGSADCTFKGIEYRNVSQYGDCWSSAISPEFCPLPAEISCKLEGSIPLTNIALMKYMSN